MFDLHQREQRIACRAIFLLIGVLPSILVVGFTVHWLLPGRAGRMAAKLSPLFATDVSLERVAALRPRQWRVERLRWRDVETGETFATADDLLIDLRNNEYRITAANFVLSWQHRDAIFRWLHAWLRRDAPAELTIRTRLANIVDGPPDSNRPVLHPLWEIHQPQVRIATAKQEGLASGRVLQVTAPAESPPDGPAFELQVSRHRQTTPPSTRVHVDTGPARVPAALLANAVPLAGDLGRAATFRGRFAIVAFDGVSTGQAAGKFSDVDFGRLLRDCSPHFIDARGQLEWHELAWKRRRALVARGRVAAADGSIGRSLLDAATKGLLCEQGQTTGDANAANPITFDHLAFRFSLTAAGLTVWGDCDPPPAAKTGVVLLRGQRVLLRQPPFVELPLSRLVVALTAPGVDYLPATLEARELATWLPWEKAAAATARRQQREDRHSQHY